MDRQTVTATLSGYLDIWPVGSCYMRSWPGQLGETLSYSRRKSCISEEGHHHRCMLKEGKLILQGGLQLGEGGHLISHLFNPAWCQPPQSISVMAVERFRTSGAFGRRPGEIWAGPGHSDQTQQVIVWKTFKNSIALINSKLQEVWADSGW